MADQGGAPLVRVLVVDDEPSLLSALCQILGTEGYSATGVQSGHEALAALSAALAGVGTSFDVLITDLKMAVMDGISLLHAAQRIDGDLVCIIMTGHASIDSAVEAMRGGALDYILKPFKLNSVVPVLARAYGVRRLRLENRALMEQVTRRTRQLEVANRELVRSNQELEAFIHSVSHDLRQPLNAVIGFSDLLIGGKPGALNPTQKEYVAEILEAGNRLLRLTEDLLRFSRLGQQRLHKEWVDIDKLVADIVRELRNAEPERQIEVRVGPLPEASADPSLLKQVFINVLANAFKFTRQSPHAVVEISGEHSADARTYRIRDNGAGFDMAHAHRLFTIFQRLHADGDFEGTGVGLSIVQRIIERHGGTVRAEGAIGRGATFIFTLPV
ncbi:MAG TPA: ATP-binding protein [Steroidobacteraceae bacterium]|jgi:hypothetical protein